MSVRADVAAHLGAKHYVIFTYMASKPEIDGQCGLVVARTSSEAFDFAITNFRKSASLKPQDHVDCKKLFESEDELLAEAFYNNFIEEVRKDAMTRKKGGDIPDGEN